MFKKTIIATLVLAAAGAANAGMYQCKPGDVTVPCAMNAWDVGADALIFEQRSGINNGLVGANMDWKWGFRIEGSYHWGTGNDMNVNWAHYNNTTTFVPTANQIANSGLDGIALANSVGTRVSVNSAFDIINIEFGQHVDFGEVWDIRFHGGIEGAYLRNASYGPSLTGTVPFVIIPALGGGTVTTNLADTVKISGWGPRAGADMAYNMDSGVAFFANGAFSVLSSKIRSTNAAASPFPAPIGQNNVMLTQTEYKLGAKYVQPMAQGDLTWRVAWEAHDFIGALPGGTNLAWDGVSFGLKWLGQA